MHELNVLLKIEFKRLFKNKLIMIEEDGLYKRKGR